MYQNNCSKYCPPTCSFEINYCDYPVFCDDYDCTNPETCTQMIPSDCVTYEGSLFEQYGIQSGVTVTELIQSLAQLIYPDCYTNTTTTIPPVCYNYVVTLTSGPLAFIYINCDGEEILIDNMTGGATIICAQENTLEILSGTANIAESSLCGL